MPRLHGYSLLGQRCFGQRDFGNKKRVNVIGAQHQDKLLTISLFEQQPINTLVFNSWLDQDLIPKLPDNSVLVLDNASFHQPIIIEQKLARHGHHVLFLPTYSPELNPIEHKWAQAKALRRKQQCSVQELFQKYQI